MSVPLELTRAHSTHTLSLFSLQRIAASELAPGLQHFGCSIHGQLDLNEDGLVDLAVGALGNAVVLWSVPVFSNYKTSLRVTRIECFQNLLLGPCLLVLATVIQMNPKPLPFRVILKS